MRATLVSYGSTGDLLPLVALAVALREAGHEVVALGDEAGAPLAERYEIEFHALEGSLEDEMQPGGSLAVSYTHLEGGAVDEVVLPPLRGVLTRDPEIIGEDLCGDR